ncbi:MAG TPA: acetylglutamate kinase [Rectinema sp.]|jgi:acetylglutamate kinase|nr:acetylglutamate kinase [Spirochaetia bacterium]MDI9427911.1 acetylglutamate kinase [Spirochaetota bacterium]NLH89141.1 acetylglutamate kinase [Treponema sp.]OQC73163.1 MAG: Acetylglutamate kinase [Spirochaetes bacterium ADurb.Bin001]HNP93472.1 acetylglutamate kinase [Rectinema sp.]
MDKHFNADVLIEALPYLRKFCGKIIVIKYGGAAMINEGVRQTVIQDLILMQQVGMKPVLVHGGGPEIDKMLKKLNKEAIFVNGLRYTDDETMEIVQMVLAGKVNKDLVELFARMGGKAMGICGSDGGLFMAKRMRKNGQDLGLVGDIQEVKTDAIRVLLDNGIIPVIASIALRADEGSGFYNVNADSAAGAVAIALKAEKLILLTDVPGVMEDRVDVGTLIREMDVEMAKTLMKKGVIKAGMIPKVEGCLQALAQGVTAAHIVDGRSPHSLLVELFTDTGMGTMIR